MMEVLEYTAGVDRKRQYRSRVANRGLAMPLPQAHIRRRSRFWQKRFGAAGVQLMEVLANLTRQIPAGRGTWSAADRIAARSLL